MMRQLMVFLLCCGTLIASAQQPVDYVNPFIGTSNYGTTNPGAICPQGMMSVVPFNVMGSEKNRFDKDTQWRCRMSRTWQLAADAYHRRIERGLS